MFKLMFINFLRKTRIFVAVEISKTMDRIMSIYKLTDQDNLRAN